MYFSAEMSPWPEIAKIAISNTMRIIPDEALEPPYIGSCCQGALWTILMNIFSIGMAVELVPPGEALFRPPRPPRSQQLRGLIGACRQGQRASQAGRRHERPIDERAVQWIGLYFRTRISVASTSAQ